MAQYTEITLNELLTLLKECGGRRWREIENASTKEYVYEYPLERNSNIVVKLYSSIHLETNVSRSKGADAIRVCAVDIEKKQGWIKTVKVLRVAGWRENLRKAIKKVITDADNRLGVQPKVQNEMSERKKISQFVWTKSDNSYMTESSTLDANKEKLPRNVCPHCEGYYQKKNLVKVNKIDNEITHWEFKCPNCQTILVIFND